MSGGYGRPLVGYLELWDVCWLLLGLCSFGFSLGGWSHIFV